jgi:CRISPR-associated endonuclease/helicase Cas3
VLALKFENFLAKSNPPISVAEHNKGLFASFDTLKPFLNKERLSKYLQVIEKLLEFHDYGKINQKFQDKLSKKKRHNDEIPHEWLSIAFVDTKIKKWLKDYDNGEVRFYTLFCYCILNHHNRNKEFSLDSVVKTINYDLSKKCPDFEFNRDYDIHKDFNNKISNNFEAYFNDLVFFKGILHKCDYSASAGILPERDYQGDYKNDFESGLVKKGIANLREFQKRARDLSNKSIILIASTGMGKTEYSMNWINGNKAFYLLGLKIAVNAMFERFKDFFSEQNVSLLHGDVKYQLAAEEDSLDDFNFKLAKARQFSYPLTIATADQLITSVFKFNGFELHYLTASYSKIVIDEIQSFSPESIACIVVFLQEIAGLGGKFLLMTATLPRFIKNELKDIAHFEEPQYLPIKRHKIKVVDLNIEEFDFESIDSKKVLIICNTVGKAQLIYEKLKERNPNLLHARFINCHKKSKEDEILKCESGIWITTQIVEASLDIDFDLLLTECSAIDSFLQRLGRCYRKREYSQTIPNILIFKFDQISKTIYDPEILERSLKVLQEYDEFLLTEEQKQEMINKVFEDIENTKYYQSYNKYKTLLKSGFRAENKGEAQELFRKITNTYNIIPKPLYLKNQNEIDTLIKDIDNSSGIEKFKLKKEFNDFCVGIQLLGKKKTDLLKDFGIESNFLKKEEIKLLDGITYTYEKGVEFIKEFKDMDNFIF